MLNLSHSTSKNSFILKFFLWKTEFKTYTKQIEQRAGYLTPPKKHRSLNL